MQLQDLKTLSRDTSISPFTLRKFVRKGLPHYRLGRKILIDPEEFKEWFFQRYRAEATITSEGLDRLIAEALDKVEKSPA